MPDKKRRGRAPTLRNPENAKLICERIAERVTLREIAKELGCNAGSIARWAIEDAEFGQQYARAMEIRVELMGEDIQEISDCGSDDVQRDRLRVDTRKWLMSKMAPKKYGERITAEHTGTVKHEVEHRVAEAKQLIADVFGEE